MQKILQYFHHIHHNKNKTHRIEHCGGIHKKKNSKLNYTITHCSCGKHKIDKKTAIGHDFDYVENKIEFFEKCPEGGWHVESGEIL